MSEKDECPRCGSFSSELHYQGHHEYCGYNCGRAVYRATVSAAGPREDGWSLLSEMSADFFSPLTQAQIVALQSGYVAALQDAWDVNVVAEVHVHLTYSGIFGSVDSRSPFMFATVPEVEAWLADRDRSEFVQRVADFYGVAAVV